MNPEVVVFESWHGQHSDNPRAISEGLLSRRPDLRQVWAVGSRDQALPPEVTAVRVDSGEYLRWLGRAAYLVTNNTMPRYYRKPSACTYVQTWHGTPLKRIAFDIERPAFEGSERYMKQLEREVASWDFLVSPNRFSTEAFRQAFRYGGEIIESGYPRNDFLSSVEPHDRQALRARLGLPEGARVILYVPTWRDGADFSLRLDLAALSDSLGEEHFVLLRLHHLDADASVGHDHPRVLDVSDYPDVKDLFLVADVLVTDYSSVMFDFAVTRKPMLFFTYDLEDYRDRLRGFYFDFEKEAPGPLLETSDAVIAALADLPKLTSDYEGSYRRFVNRFCHLDDGHATQRVIEAVFSPGG